MMRAHRGVFGGEGGGGAPAVLHRMLIVIPFAAMGCASVGSAGSGGEEGPAGGPPAAPESIRVSHAPLARAAITRSIDLFSALERTGASSTSSSDQSDVMGSPSIGGIAPNEAIDLDMEAERAAEEDLLDEIEREASRAIPPVLAVTGTVTFDIPMAEDERIEQWIQYLVGRGRKWYEIWLARSTRFVPIFQPILQEHGLPKDLIFLSMIESGFSPNAYSWAHAAGPWQFMPFTGRRYGLEVGFWLDERRDFVLSTHAAARYLTKLHEQFGDWHLAWAAYNAGEGRVARAIRRSGVHDFWRLSRTWHLRRETRHYVPKLLAAAIIAKQPERYGFEGIDYLPRLEWEVLTVTTAIDLATLSRACHHAATSTGTLAGPDSDAGAAAARARDARAIEDELKSLNPALRRYVTPPGRSYDLRVPNGLKDRCAEGLGMIPATDRVTYRYHRIQRGDTPASIAKRYQTTPEAILRFNNLDAKRLRHFEEIVVPIPASKDAEVPILKPPVITRGGEYVPDGSPMIIHRVAEGDSLWKIARRYGVSLKKLRLWNGLWRNARLQVGQRIRVYVGRGRST